MRPQTADQAQWPVRGSEGDAAGEGVDGAEFDAPAFFVGFAAREAAGFEREPAMGDAEGGDVGDDVRRVLIVIGEDGERLFGLGGAVGIGDGADGGVAAEAVVEIE